MRGQLSPCYFKYSESFEAWVCPDYLMRFSGDCAVYICIIQSSIKNLHMVRLQFGVLLTPRLRSCYLSFSCHKTPLLSYKVTVDFLLMGHSFEAPILLTLRLMIIRVALVH